jgi:Dolichyl-phosphate-mannose-protein mannosyltransferase
MQTADGDSPPRLLRFHGRAPSLPRSERREQHAQSSVALLEKQQWDGIAALVELSAYSQVASSGEAAGAAPGGYQGAARCGPWFARAGLLLPAILVLQAALSLRLVWANTAYQDEALYLWAGHLELTHWTDSTAVPAFQTYFSGSPALYPPIAALADNVAGLTGARILSLAFMLGSTCLLYGTTKRLLNRRAAVAAAAFFGTFGLGVELGAFATYDAMAIFLTALAAYLVVRAGQAASGEPLLMLAGVILALAAATKYASALWAPVIICLAALAATRGSLVRRLLRAVRLTCYITVPAGVGLLLGGPSYAQGIAFTTLHRQIVTGTPPLRVLDIAWGWLALLFLLGILGVMLIWHDTGRFGAGPLVLLAAAVLAPVAQALIHDVTSLHKQVVFGAWFLCAAAGYAVSRIAFLDGTLSQGVVISVVLLGVSTSTGYAQAADIFASWPSVAAAMPALGRAITADRCPCLITEESAAEYYLPAADMAGPIVGPYTFTYRDADTRGTLSGQAAMAAAIMNGYFGVVQIDGLRSRAMYRQLETSLHRSKQYRLIFARAWRAEPHEPTQVWQRIARAGA